LYAWTIDFVLVRMQICAERLKHFVDNFGGDSTMRLFAPRSFLQSESLEMQFLSSGVPPHLSVQMGVSFLR
jgi:hypothetical protein